MGPLGQLGMNNPGVPTIPGPVGPAALGGQRPGTPNPRMPIVDPRSTQLGGLRGAMQMSDQQMMNAAPRLQQMQAAYARGGRHHHKLGAHGHHAVKTAMGHLQNGDPASAMAALQSSSEAMQHPDVQNALAQLAQMEGPPPGAPAIDPNAAGGMG